MRQGGQHLLKLRMHNSVRSLDKTSLSSFALKNICFLQKKNNEKIFALKLEFSKDRCLLLICVCV